LPTIPGIPPLFGTPAPSAAPTAPVEPQSDDRVIVFGAKWCGACRQLKQDLDARHIPYTFVDVEDPHAMASPAGVHAAEMPQSMRNSIPATRVVQKNGQPLWVSGADPDRIEKAYRGT
jgi:hypothetical protein